MPGHDYSAPGAYFITVCTKNRELLFDDNRLRSIARTAWLQIPTHYPSVELDVFVVMPNHIHGLVTLCDPVGTGLQLSDEASSSGLPKPVPTADGHRRTSIPAIMRWYKTVTGRRINRLRRQAGEAVWQRSYYDHIARSDHGLESIRRYIELNPANWDSDPENPSRNAMSGEDEFWRRIVDEGVLTYPEDLQ
jgi:putative transposase